MRVEEINFKTYALGIRNIANTNPNNDFDLLVSEGLLCWLSERAINLDCFVVTNRAGDVDGYFAIRIIEGCALLEDWHIAPISALNRNSSELSRKLYALEKIL